MAQNMVRGLVLSRCILSQQSSLLIPHRSVMVLKRKWEVPLVKRSKPVTARKMKEKHYIYDIVRNTKLTKLPDIECLLTRHVDGIGAGGEIVSVNRMLFRHELFPSGAAVYPTAENIEEYQDETMLPKHKRTPNALVMYRLLWGMTLPINMNAHQTWELSKDNIKVALRLAGVYVECIESITLPEEIITHEHDEQVPFYVKVKVNGLDEADVRCYIHPFTTDTAKQSELPAPPQTPLFGDPQLVDKELKEKGLYYGTVDNETPKS